MRHRSGVAFPVQKFEGSAKALSFQYGGCPPRRATLGAHVYRLDDAKWPEGNEISDPVFEQSKIDILAAIEDSEDHYLLLLDGEGDADPAPIADDPDGAGVFGPRGSPCGKGRKAKAITMNAAYECPGNGRDARFSM
jgi:hypothetical protein